MTTTDLQVTGMSCASCAAKIERGLNDLDGVRATVNFAVERAHVEHGGQVSEHDLIHAVESTGYHASVIDHSGENHMNHDVPADQLRPRLIGSAVLALPVLALSMVMPWQFPGWQWVVLALTTPIVGWGGYPFHKAALNSARHGSSTMDTLVSIGTLAAFLWSVVAVVTGHGHVYFEVAAAVTVFLLGGRYAEAKAKRSAGAALQALLSLGAKDAIVVRDDAEVRIPVADLRVGDVIVVRPGERVATDGVVVDGVSALDTSAMTGESVPVDVGPGAEAAIEHQLHVACTLQAAAMAGAMDIVLAMTVEYLGDRFSFGRPLSSYQALKHRVADLKVWVEAAHAIATGAARAVAHGSPDAADVVDAAQRWIGPRATDLVQDCIQLHGGIGVTWEHDLHLYLRRTTVDRATYGTPDDHGERFASRLLGVAS